MRPVIGVTPDFNPGDQKDMGGKEPTYFLRARYLNAIQALGGIPLVLPVSSNTPTLRQILAGVHGLMVTGSGSDLDPRCYRERQRFPFRRMSQLRADLELGIINLAYRANVPILGICGGMQSMNVALGGTLFQDIHSQISSALPHQPPYPAIKVAHAIQVAPHTVLRKITRKAIIAVNSSHHQSIKSVAPSLISTALASDGVIEAIEAPSRTFFLGVQWHPEFLYDRDPIQRRLFSAFMKAAKYSTTQ